MLLFGALLSILAQVSSVKANVEKTIFLAPALETVSNAHPAIGSLRLNSLSTLNPIVSTQLPVQFPTKSRPHGLDAWYLVQDLVPGQRHEIRVCWPATQPTDFWLATYSLAQVFDTPALVSSLEQYTKQIQPHSDGVHLPSHRVQRFTSQSLLFLRVQAAASYYSTNQTLMDSPLPVDVDIILDPFILNVFPKSLGPFALYVSAVAVGAWVLSGYIYRWLRSIPAQQPTKPHTD